MNLTENDDIEDPNQLNVQADMTKSMNYDKI